jgi:hypothetical protein
MFLLMEVLLVKEEEAAVRCKPTLQIHQVSRAENQENLVKREIVAW